MTQSKSTSDSGWAGQLGLTDSASEYNSQQFMIDQAMGRIATVRVVKVVGVTNDGGLSPVGFVDVLPMVNQMDGQGNVVKHTTIYHIPYTRVQGGSNAIIMDPRVGDIGWAGFCDRDISAVKSSGAQSNPGSMRRFDLADGIYIGGILNGVPSSYVQWGSDGSITMSPDSGTTFIKLEAGKITLQAAEIVGHATTKNAWDAGGTGFVYQVAQIDTYTTGVASTAHAPHPPEVPT